MPELEGKVALITGMFFTSRVLTFHSAEVLTFKMFSIKHLISLVFPLKFLF